MAKFVMSPNFESVSGKACSHSDVVYCTNKQTGKTYQQIRHSHTDANTELQQEHRENFKARSLQVKTWFATNKPSDANPKGTALYQAARAKFKAQHKIGAFVGYVSKYLQDDGTMGAAYVYPKTGEGASGGTTNPPAGGGGGGTSFDE